jgi:hypothetical protein
MGGRRQRDRKASHVVVGVAAAVLLVAAVFAAVSLVDTGAQLAKSVSPAEWGRVAARRVNRVVSTGDLSDPPGVTSRASVKCSQGSGYPGISITYSGSAAAAPDDVREQLNDARWRETRIPFGYLYQKRFGDWSADFRIGTQGTEFAWPLVGYLTVEGKIDGDCDTFRGGIGR